MRTKNAPECPVAPEAVAATAATTATAATVNGGEERGAGSHGSVCHARVVATLGRMRRDAASEIRRIASERILVLDGAWGTLIHGSGFGPGRLPRRAVRRATTGDVTGDPDILNLTRPDFVASAHERYLAAGADITTTNTFTATSIGQADYAPRGRTSTR